MSPTPYRPRRTEPFGVHEVAGWAVKVIGIGADGRLPDETERQAALAVAAQLLPRESTPATATATVTATVTADAVRAGFVIVHPGEEALWVIVAWWRLDILYQRLYRAELGTVELLPVPPDGPTACVWELLAIDHERRAWVEHVLTDPARPDPAAYLAAGLVVYG
ncbi:MAG TPA: hypothetical protein VNP03_16180 [Pseudonocardia sp.]|nr:hypothetical protein [Pseudonocardia sp.]